MKTNPIYLDHHATTPLDPHVWEAMKPYFQNHFGNPASRDHCFGWEAEKGVEQARETIAQAINADPEEILFTSGATESDNLAIKGVAEMYAEKGKHIITAQTEHRAVLDSAQSLEKKGFQITTLPVDRYGQVLLQDVIQAVSSETILISIMAANNEVGTLNPIGEIGKFAQERGIFFHTDAAQAVGKIGIDVKARNIDLMSFSAHKMYGPKGIGALYVRRKNRRVRLVPLIDGGGHERGYRSGTLNVPAIVGFAKALEISLQSMEKENQRLKSLRDRLERSLMQEIEEVQLNGHPTERLSGNLNLSFSYIESEALIKGLSQEIAVSMGSACASAKPEPSYVLKAMGCDAERIHNSIRFGLGRFTTEAEIDRTIQTVSKIVLQLRAQSPLLSLAKNP